MSHTYTRWIQHGEPLDLAIIEDAPNGGNNGGHARDDNDNMYTDDESDDDGGHSVPDMLQDLKHAGDALTANQIDANVPTNGKHEKLFAKLMEEAKRKLYPVSKHSRLAFFVKLLHHKSYHRITNTTFDD